MAKYQAAPFYEVDSGDVRIKFDFFGAYATDKADEIAVLDGLCPVWIKRVDEPSKPEEPEAPAKPARKSSAK